MATTDPPPTDPSIAAARHVAEAQGHVMSRRQLDDLGVTRWQIRLHVRGGRWQLIGDQSVVLHNAGVSRAGTGGRPSSRADRGPASTGHLPSRQQGSDASSTSASASRCRGGRGCAVPRSTTSARPVAGRPTTSYPWRVPRTRPAVAAVRGALWAGSDREATLLLTMAVQQGVTTAQRVGLELIRVKRDRRRLLLHVLVNELLAGARSLGELDLVAERRYYLDLYFDDWHLEVDGIHHSWAENTVSDALRQNALSLAGDTVLRVPLLGLRLQRDDFFAQIGQALTDAGWSPDLPDAA